MKALSLFNGISALHLALDKAEIKVSQVYYAEIDKYANKITEQHYPDDVALGDATKWREWNIDWADIGLVGAGFPCQAWSVAGKQLGDKDERGMLFWTTLEIIAHVLKHNPKAKFLMENVKMKKDFEQYITHHTEQALGYVEKIMIDSALVSAQSRKRYYWTNFEVTQPDDKGVLLKDILDGEINSEFYYSEKSIAYMERGSEKWMQAGSRRADRYTQRATDDKSFTLTANMHKGVPYNYFECSNGYRKLTTLECERLQTFPDGWTDFVSNTQRYKALGNAWTVDVIVHILKCAF